MRLETNDKKFKEIMIVTSQILDTIKLECDKDGVRFSGLDKSHICFIKTEFKNTHFTEYECETPDTLVVYTSDLVKVLNRMGTDDTMIISNDKEHLKVTYESDVTRRFNIILLDNDYSTPAMPNIQYPNNNVEISFKEFNDCLKDISLYSDKVKLCMDVDDRVFLVCDGVNGSYTGELLSSSRVDKVVSSTYSLEFMNRFKGLVKVGDFLRLSMGKDTPLLYLVEDLSEEVKVMVLLAPRIEEDY